MVGGKKVRGSRFARKGSAAGRIAHAQSKLGTADLKGGFDLFVPSVKHYKHFELLQTAVKDQSDALEYSSAACLKGVDITGHVPGTSLRFTRAAFGDMCHFARIPVGFIKRLAVADEQLALDVVERALGSWFGSGTDRRLVVDTRDDTIQGIVGTDTYKAVSNLRLLDFASSAVDSMDLTGGWLQGSNLRFTLVNDAKVDVNGLKKGDYVQFGIDVGNAMNGDRAVTIMDYALRLSCDNGMRVAEPGHAEHIVHRGDIAERIQASMVASALRSDFLAPLMRRASKQILGPTEVANALSYIEEGSHGGSKKLKDVAFSNAKIEALSESHGDQLTLWNLVSGVTEAAKSVESVEHRGRLEALGYFTLARFATPVGNN